MSDMASRDPADRQLPVDEEIFLDHIGDFVSDPETASAALIRAGFTPTPVSVQVNPDPAGGPPKLTGTGNVCVMLERGYLEYLFKTADTPLGQEFDAAMTRYPGVHLAAFAIASAETWHERLGAAGFDMQPLVNMERPVETADGEGVAGFHVVRLAPGQMPEGRTQMLRHRTEYTVWQPRWLEHANTAFALSRLTIAVPDVAEAAGRFARFTGVEATGTTDRQRLALDRGALEIVSPEAFGALWPNVDQPMPPFMGAAEVAVHSLADAKAALASGGLDWTDNDKGITVAFPPELGHGVWCFSERWPA